MKVIEPSSKYPATGPGHLNACLSYCSCSQLWEGLEDMVGKMRERNGSLDVARSSPGGSFHPYWGQTSVQCADQGFKVPLAPACTYAL